MSPATLGALTFAAVHLALLLLFAAGLRLPVGFRRWPRWLERALLVATALGAVVLAEVAVYRHDVHLDLTEAHAFSPAPEVERMVRGLQEDVELLYFYQRQDPAAAATKTMLEILGRSSPRLHVRTIDPDQYPGLASQYGVRAYNVAVLECGGRTVKVQSSSDREIALGIVRVTRAAPKVVCFAVGHGEYDVDNFEYHTHFEGTGGHNHGAEGASVVQMEAHGFGRVRRALDSLGYATRKVTLATAGRVDPDCSVLVEPGPRTAATPTEADALGDYLARGGSALLMYDLDAALDPATLRLLDRVGAAPGAGAVIDPLEHYFTDEQMVAVSRYRDHPITRGLALTFFPGARPIVLGAPPPGVTVTPLAASSGESWVRPAEARGARAAPAGPPGPSTLAVALEGTWPGGEPGRPFRLVVLGDVDFASNSFFPYMSNADLFLSTTAWLAREERGATMKPAKEVLPQVLLTAQDMRVIFGLTVIAMPGLAALLGGLLWWRRRR